MVSVPDQHHQHGPDRHRRGEHRHRQDGRPAHGLHHGARGRVRRLLHDHADPSGSRNGAGAQQQHQFMGTGSADLRFSHDVPPLIGLQLRPGRRHAGRHVGHRHGARGLRQCHPGSRPRCSADRSAHDPRNQDDRSRTSAERAVPGTGQCCLGQCQLGAGTYADPQQHIGQQRDERCLRELGVQHEHRGRHGQPGVRQRHPPPAQCQRDQHRRDFDRHDCGPANHVDQRHHQ